MEKHKLQDGRGQYRSPANTGLLATAVGACKLVGSLPASCMKAGAMMLPPSTNSPHFVL